MHKRLFEEVDGFDETLFLEDLDFCIRVQLHGARIELVPDAVLHYRYRDSYSGIFRQAYNYGDGHRGDPAPVQGAGAALSPGRTGGS